MTTRVQHRRFTTAGQLPPSSMAPGELSVNLADLDLFTSASGAPLRMIGVRPHATTARYLPGQLVVQAGLVYTCKNATGPGAFVAADWSNTGDANTQSFVDAGIAAHEAKADPHPTYLSKYGGTVVGDVTFAGYTFMQNPIRVLGGTPTLPSYSFTADADTGFYSPAPGVIALVTDGVERQRWSSAGVSNTIPTGTILDFAGTVAPSGYVLCDGAAYSRTGQAALFAVIGTTWGAGDGSSTFNVPDLRRRVTIGAGGTSVSAPGTAVGSTGGAESKQLTVAEMPVHAHGVNDPTHAHSVYDPGHAHSYSNAGAGQGQPPQANANTNTGGTSVTSTNGTGIGIYAAGTGISIANTGSSNAWSLMQPSAVVNKIIKV